MALTANRVNTNNKSNDIYSRVLLPTYRYLHIVI